jgi:hypothetical protein
MTSISTVSLVESSMMHCLEQFLGNDREAVVLAEVVDEP